MKTVRAIISGRVQGVWYRAWTTETARQLGLAGWVRNCVDGTVEAVFHGPDGAVEEMLCRCHDGPPAARVDSVRTEPYAGDPGTEFRRLG